MPINTPTGNSSYGTYFSLESSILLLALSFSFFFIDGWIYRNLLRVRISVADLMEKLIAKTKLLGWSKNPINLEVEPGAGTKRS